MKFISPIFLLLILSLPLFTESAIAQKGKLFLSQIFSLETPGDKRYNLPESYQQKFSQVNGGVMEEEFDEQEGNEEEQENEELEEEA
ncbi:MAG: hypothetical protein H7A24_12705 [Leptospiraceae bacterium]|nr:hypothetical protein [Leptospiraceae bacterium]MCP5512736.1 hypothetical protein [Leptospiraceae bacterium]